MTKHRELARQIFVEISYAYSKIITKYEMEAEEIEIFMPPYIDIDNIRYYFEDVFDAEVD